MKSYCKQLFRRSQKDGRNITFLYSFYGLLLELVGIFFIELNYQTQRFMFQEREHDVTALYHRHIHDFCNYVLLELKCKYTGHCRNPLYFV